MSEPTVNMSLRSSSCDVGVRVCEHACQHEETCLSLNEQLYELFAFVFLHVENT